MENNTDLLEYTAKFKYKKDGIFGTWGITSIGDCEDFALTVSYILSNKSKLKLMWHILTLRFVFWRCRADWNGQDHWVLQDKQNGYIDNIHPDWRKNTPHKKLFPLPLLPVLMVLFASTKNL